MSQELPELMTASEVAKVFRVSRSTLAGWAKRGLIEYTTTPTGHRRFHRATVERLLRERASEPT